MTKYEELKKVICEALPRLKNDVVGQNYQRNYELYELVAKSNNGFTVLCWADMKFSFYTPYELKTLFETLGIDPTLSDVLLWIQNKETDASFNTFGMWLTDEISWDLSKPLLKDQSEELIDYLISIKSQS